MNDEDQMLLQLAAKAAGIEIEWRESVGCLCHARSPYNVAWNPLNHDGTALRLSVKARIDVLQGDSQVVVAWDPHCSLTVAAGSDREAATRRAIALAAAEIGRRMAANVRANLPP